MNLAYRIKQLRQESGLTQEEFGQKFGIVKSTVSLYESGKSTPNDDIKKRICSYFDITMDYLHGITDNRKKENYISLSAEEAELISYYRNLNLQDKRWIMGKMVEQIKSYEKESVAAEESPGKSLPSSGTEGP